MQLDANDLILFARVLQAGSFSRAAERLGIPKSSVSRRIAALESSLGEQLLTRSTRRLAPTEFGLGIAEHANRLAAEADAAADYSQSRHEVPRGRLKVSMPPDFASVMLEPMLLQFMRDYPDIQLHIDSSARRVDLIAEQFDLALRAAATLPDDATLVARRICQLHSRLYASPVYLAKHGTPTTPQALEQHRGLQLIRSNGASVPWELQRGSHSWSGYAPGQIAANSLALLRSLCCEGLGIAALPHHYLGDLLATGQLVEILPDWQLPSQNLWAVLPSRRLIPLRTRVFIDALKARLDKLKAPA